MNTRQELLTAMGTREALERLRALVEETPALERSVEEAKAHVGATREALDLRANEVQALGVEGKNEGERKATLALVLAKDVEYLARYAETRKAEALLLDAEEAARRARHEERYLYAFLALRTAQVSFLAGGGDEP